MAEPASLPPDRAGVLAEIDRVLRAQLEASRPLLAEEEILARGEMDSLGVTVLAVALEDRYRIVLRESDVKGIVTFAELADLVVRLAGARSARAAETPS